MYTAISVDDEKMIKKSIAALVGSHDTGFKIVGEAKDGLEAIALNEQLSPDLIITDIRMPKMNGLTFIQTLKESNAKTRFIIISGYDEFEYAQTALRYGVIDFLLKPLKPDQFLASLEKVRKKLDEDKYASEQRSEWLWSIKAFAETLVQKLWLLDEEQAFGMIDEIHAKLTEKQQDNILLKRQYLDLIIYMRGELEKQMEYMNEEEIFQVTNFPDEPDNMHKKLSQYIQEILTFIKEKRNFGRRTNILTALDYIKTNYAKEDLSLQEVADLVNMSSSYFSMEFKAEMGISFKQFLTKMRMDEAKEMLNNPAYKTYEIAQFIGYSDYPHFTKTFKKHVGVTPSQFRKRIGI
ncbi:response regulator transcription factor [Pseudalkalibacillus caeni]|uniref:Response regulator n=1 Tax=Exobacillus caeni TaxID=2574798 RepID=A0A5R9F497_9BACL|nr:response regulator [Pseudalkalibacillus caeni]TLS37220.1 response regulator [Pseudalkalibacillus caeni]